MYAEALLGIDHVRNDIHAILFSSSELLKSFARLASI